MIEERRSSERREEVARQPELYFAMVRAIGANLKPVESSLTRELLAAGFVPHKIRISREIEAEPLVAPIATGYRNEYERYDRLMTAGDVIRSVTGRPDAGALLGMSAIAKERPRLWQAAGDQGGRGVAFILSSLMHPAEVRTARDVYGPRLFVISAYSHTESRRTSLRDILTAASVEMKADLDTLVENLMARDRGRGYGPEDLLSRILDPQAHRFLSIDKTFEFGDYFVDADSGPGVMETNVKRFLSLILSAQSESPSREEMGMAHAYGARLRSASLSRQVGAAICDKQGNVIATGTNEVPKAGGGQYWGEDPSPKRDIELRFDTSDKIRRQVFEDLIDRLLGDLSWLTQSVRLVGPSSASGPEESDDSLQRRDTSTGPLGAEIARIFSDIVGSVDVNSAVNRALANPSVRGAQLFDVLEYDRSAHAEMGALCYAAWAGISTRGTVLYCTTFPCHICACLIVAAGIEKVVYIEPYPKSRVPEMYSDSIALAHKDRKADGRVVFQPFMGVSPRRHADLFSWFAKKTEDVKTSVDEILSGRVEEWNMSSGEVRHSLRVGRGEDAGEPQRAVEQHEALLISEFRNELRTAQEKFGAAIESLSVEA